MAKDAHRLEEKYISSILGNTQHTTNKIAATELDGISKTGKLATAGLVGHLFEKIALYSEWIEDNLILKSSGEGLINFIQKIGQYLINIEELLNKPRYLMIIVSITFVIII